MQSRIVFLACLVLSAIAPHVFARPEHPAAPIDHVLIISVDGMRPDCLLRADAPTMKGMLDRGSFSLWAKTTSASVTLPSHVSMLSGVVPEVHAIMWNGDMPLSQPVYPSVPTIFDLAKKAGLKTGMASGKSKFTIMGRPSSFDEQWVTPNKKCEDSEVTLNANRIIRDIKPDVMFVHLPGTDNVGHAKGWGSPEHLDAIAQADRCVMILLNAYKATGLYDKTLVIVTADHGGAGRTHGPEDPRSRTIPWIATGPGVRAGFDLTLLGKEHNVETYDTFATACFVLGIPLPIDRKIDGKPITQIFENQEMLLSTFEPKMAPSTNPTAP